MSASPSGPSPGNTPNGASLPFVRRRRNADPLVRPKKARRPPQAPAATGDPLGKARPEVSSGLQPKLHTQQAKTLPNSLAEMDPQSTNTVNNTTNSVKDPHGFSEPPKSAEHTAYYPLLTTKRALLEGLRHHIAKLSSKKAVDVRDEEQFPRPVRLYRRDPRASPAGGGGVKAEEDSKGSVTVDDKDHEQQEFVHQEREAQRQADLAQIAPTASQTIKPKKGGKEKKTQQVYRNDQTPEAQKASKLRYEETLPWHLEDSDNKNVWVGNYESALSDVHVALTPGQQCFHMVPIEKWYKFTAKNQFKALTIEEAELRMSQKVKEPRWFMKAKEDQKLKAEEVESRKQGQRLYVGKVEDASSLRKVSTGRKLDLDDANDLDFEEDRFADDEENQLIEGEEEDTKEVENRIKRDQLQANVFNLKEEQEYDREEDEEKKENALSKKLGRSVRKALRDREKNLIYDDDSDSNPYSDGTSSDHSDEAQKEEDQAKLAEAKERSKGKDADGSRLPSGESTKGTNTPSGRIKHSDPLKKAASNLKRPGSPNLSEVSGTESARKKSKKQHDSARPTATSTPKPVSRPMSPVPPTSLPESSRANAGQQGNQVLHSTTDTAKGSHATSKAAMTDKKRARPGAGSGSDADGTGAEMSDGARRKKVKGGRMGAGSNQGSRAGSPIPPGRPQEVRSKNGSRAGSPTVRAAAAAAPPLAAAAAATSPTELKEPSAADIIASIPPGGTTINELLNMFKGRTSTKRESFIALVKENAAFDPVTKKLMPKTGANTPFPSASALSP